MNINKCLIQSTSVDKEKEAMLLLVKKTDVFDAPICSMIIFKGYMNIDQHLISSIDSC